MKLRTDKPETLTARIGLPRNGSEPRAPKRRSRLSYRARNIALATGFGLLAVVLTLLYVRKYQQKVEAGAEVRTVLVAARDIPAGTLGSELGRRALVERKIARRDVVPGALAARRQIRPLVVAEPIYAGEQVTARRFRSAAAAGTSGRLSGAVRGVVVPGEADQLLAGIVRTDDRVDVVMGLRYRTPGGEERVSSRVVLRDILVLRAPVAPEGAKVGGGKGASIVLALTDRQAQKLMIATRHEWFLVLRPFGKSSDTSTPVDTSDGVLEGGSKP